MRKFTSALKRLEYQYDCVLSLHPNTPLSGVFEKVNSTMQHLFPGPYTIHVRPTEPEMNSSLHYNDLIVEFNSPEDELIFRLVNV